VIPGIQLSTRNRSKLPFFARSKAGVAVSVQNDLIATPFQDQYSSVG